MDDIRQRIIADLGEADAEYLRKVVKARYPSDEWNIYAAQASDGDNYPGDGAACVDRCRSAWR